MTLYDTILEIQKGTIRLEHIKDARNMLYNEIDDCENIIKDIETEPHVRREFQDKLTLYRKLLNRL